MVVKETMHVISPGSAHSSSSNKSGATPSATVITVPRVPADSAPRPASTKVEKLRIPRSMQLQLARSLTFGVIGEDSQLYPSSKWGSENRNQFAGEQIERPRTKPDLVITSLDERKHCPQTTQIFHIRRINQKPVCSVQTSFEDGKFAEEANQETRSVYTASYRGKDKGQDSRIVHLETKPAEGIVPVNDKASHFDVRAEMMLPVCDSTNMPSAHNPHRYLLRKRKVPPPYKTFPRTNPVTHEIQTINPITHAGSGVVYPSLEKPRMTSYQPGVPPSGELPFENEVNSGVPQGDTERISVTSLSGMQFSRRKCIPPPQGHIVAELPRPSSPVCVSSLAGKKFTRRRMLQPPAPEIHIGFDGGVNPSSSNRFDDKHLPFIRARTII